VPYSLISGDNHIDLTYCPPDLWSSQAPAKWKSLVPRVEQLDDGCHWFVEGQDKGMWNGIGPGFSKYQKGLFAHIDVMPGYGFEWNYTPGAQPRPTTPELRLADLDRDGLDAEIIYGCLMINDLIADGDHRAWANQIYTTGPRTLPDVLIPTVFSLWPSSPTMIHSWLLPKSVAVPRWVSKVGI